MRKELTQEQSKTTIENLTERWRIRTDPSKEALRAVPLLAGLDARELESIYAIAHKRTYPKGSFIFLEGEPGDAFYLILAGEVKEDFLVQVTHSPPSSSNCSLPFASACGSQMRSSRIWPCWMCLIVSARPW